MTDIRQGQKIPGELTIEKDLLVEKLKKIRLLAFDWDGIFNDGAKEATSSTFNEIDSMGINMLRFGYFLLNKENPITSIVTGEKNETALHWAEREHFHSVYLKVKNKSDVLELIRKEYKINAREILFVFDDIHDISLAREAGVSIMVQNTGSSMLVDYCRQQRYFDYLTHNPGGQYALREISEVILHLVGLFKTTTEHRISYQGIYYDYWTKRNQVETKISELLY